MVEEPIATVGDEEERTLPMEMTLCLELEITLIWDMEVMMGVMVRAWQH